MSAEDLAAKPSLRVDEDRGRRPAHPVGPHRLWNGFAAWVRRVDPDGKAHAVLVEERTKRLHLHPIMVLEHGMEADNDQGRASEQLGDPLRLRDPARDAAGAEHLECVEQHDTTPELLERERLRRVQPLRRSPRGSEGGRRYQKSPSFT